VAGLGAFAVYATWAAYQADNYYAVSYLSPFYSPLLMVKAGVAGGSMVDHAWFGAWPEWWPTWLPASPAFLILAGPGAMRFTCYYYRKAYYRAFALTPPACAVQGIRPGKYKGETSLLIIQNFHRYAMYVAIGFVIVLYWDAFQAFFYKGPETGGVSQFGVGVGTIVLLVNATLLGCYTFGCHSLRHLVGGQSDCFSCSVMARTRHKAWTFTSLLNRRHMAFAWLSLIWVGLSDVYVRLVASGVITDLNTWGVG
jgi:hypothetical protein